MIRAPTALLCMLVVGFGLGIRQDLKLLRKGNAEKVMTAIGALLEHGGQNVATQAKMMDELRLLATPGAIGQLNDSLRQLIADIEANVDTKIQAGFSATQSAIDQRFSDLSEATTTAVAKKTVADEDDSAWISCVAEEKSKRQAVEGAEQALAQAQESTVVPCQQQEDRTHFTFDGAAGNDWTFGCEFSTEGNCPTQLDSYTSHVNDMLSTLDSDAQEASQSYGEAKAACDAAKADVTAKEGALEAAGAAWTAQRQTCMAQHESRQLAMCAFGDSLQQKCSKAAAFTTLMTEIDEVNGGAHSQPDREQEWRTTQVTKCMLSHIISGGDVSDATLAQCESAVDFAGDVGVLDRKDGSQAPAPAPGTGSPCETDAESCECFEDRDPNYCHNCVVNGFGCGVCESFCRDYLANPGGPGDTFADLMTPDRFTCTEETITFHGETWEVPQGSAPHSSEYKKVPYHPAVNVLDPPAFSFC